MVCKWKLAEFLDLFSDLDPDDKEDNFFDKKKKALQGLFNKWFGGGSGGNPRKQLLTKGAFVGTLVLVIYLIFGYGAATKIEIEKIECASSDKKLTLKAKGYSHNFVIPEDLDGKVYSEVLPAGNSDSIYQVTVHSDHGKISFNVNKSTTPSNWNYQISNGCIFSKTINSTTTGTSTTCSCGKNSCGDCCNQTNCSDPKCSCWTFMSLIDRAILNPIDPQKVINPKSIFFTLLPSLLYVGIMMFLVKFATRGAGAGGAGMLGFGGGQIGKTTKTKLTFKDVGGIKEEKEELEEIVDYLKNPSKYDAMGASIPKGVILYGPPGTGKTLLAKAVSGEADVPFMEVSGSSFDEVFVGLGAKRVRELFAKARKLAPCIIFIDEIDSVAGKRGNKSVGGGGVGDQTINQLLAEMDGFNSSQGIMVMAATNRLDVLDDAILRPGRFDRHIRVDLPDVLEREEILKVHSKNKNLSSSVVLADVARRTPGFSGAQLKNVLNEAALMAVRDGKRIIDAKHLDEAADRVIAGPAKKSRKITFNEKKQIAYHEAGHAIAGLYCEGGEVVEKVTIIPRGQAAGYMLSLPPQEVFIDRKDVLLAKITTTLAGRAAEEVFFGEDKITVGAANDLFKVTNIVRNMITKCGMSKNLGLVQYEPSEGISNPYRKDHSERYSELIDDEMREIILTQYEKAKQIIIENKFEFLLIVETLLLIETIDRKQIDFIHENKTLPIEAIEMKKKLIKEDQEINIYV